MGIKDCFEMKVDYMDLSSGNIYKIQEYFHRKKLGLPNPGIEIVDSFGNHIGYIDPDIFS